MAFGDGFGSEEEVVRHGGSPGGFIGGVAVRMILEMRRTL
jgi:hypothetical protein